jgi:biotin transport system ATP-binding protein
VARTSVGMVFQNARDQFVAATIGADVAFGPENLGLAREEIDRRVREALAAVGMDGRRSAYVDALSGGEQARVAIAGALAMEPAHLVLDEPFAGLDLPARRTLLAHLDSIAEETSIVVVTHDLRDLLSRADRVLVMQDGGLALSGTPDEVRESLPDLDVAVPSC